MATKLFLLATYEHLLPYDTSSYLAFGMNLTVAIDATPTPTNTQSLKPWTWEGVSSIACRLVSINPVGTPKDPGAVTMVPLTFNGQSVHTLTELKQRLAAALDDEFGRCSGEGFVWNPGQGSRMTARISSTPELAAMRPWHAILKQTSRCPAPIPQLLRLSFLFHVPKPDPMPAGTLALLAAPVLAATPGVFADPVTPDPAKLDLSSIPNDGTYTWGFDNGTQDGLAIVQRSKIAVVRSSGVATPPYINLASLWVGAPSGLKDDTFDEDWRAELEHRMAGALDLGARILEAVRRDAAKPNPADRTIDKNKTNRTLVTNLVLASLRDIAGVGYRRSRAGRALVDSLILKLADSHKPLFEAPEEHPDVYVQALETRVATLYPKIAEWKKALRDAIPALATSHLLQKTDPPFVDERNYDEALEELERIRLTVLEPANLDLLVRAQWKAIQLETPTRKVLDELAALPRLAVVDLRRQLALDNLWLLWPDFMALPSMVMQGGVSVPDETGRARVRNMFACLFLAYFKKRFKISGLSAPVACGDIDTILPHYRDQMPGLDSGVTVPAAVARLIADELVSWSTVTARRLAGERQFDEPTVSPANPGANPKTAPTDVPHALTFQVDSLGALPLDSKDPDADLLDHIAGIGVLMREFSPSNTPWRCLNFAAPVIRKPGVPSHPCTDAPEQFNTIVPSRISYQNDLRQSFVSYNNHPLSAESPASFFSPQTLKSPPGDPLRPPNAEAAQFDNVAALVRYTTSRSNPPNIPRLKFGSSYRILPFLASNSGSLPKGLAGAMPYEPDLAKFNAGNPDTTYQSLIREVTYLRMVRVGDLRISTTRSAKPADSETSLQLPEIPDGVFPRARDIATDQLNPDGTPERELPLLLLSPWGDSNQGPAPVQCTLFVRRPATDLNTWDRWQTGNENERIAVWADYHRGVDENRRASSSATCHNLSIDDPAVAGKLYLSLFECGEGAVPTPVGNKTFAAYPESDTGTGADPLLSSVRRGPVTVKIVVDDTATGNPAVTTGQNDFTVRVRPGRIYRLELSSAISSADIDPSGRPKFANIFPDNLPSVEGGSLRLVSPTAILIEVATGELIEHAKAQGLSDSAFLHSALNPVFDGTTHTIAVGLQDVALNSRDTTSVYEFKYLHRAEILRQAWRWQGREPAKHPRIFETCDNRDSEAAAIALWEEREFGNRRDIDHLAASMESRISGLTGRRAFSYREILVREGQTRGEYRALHYRFSIVAHSRYAPLMPSGQPRSVSAEGDASIWKSLFVPCRKREPLDPPKVKLILPLTESFCQESAGSPGLLVVFDEPWHEVGGLGERIKVEVAIVRDPEDKPYFETGPDPLLSSVDRGLSIFNRDCVTIESDAIHGPIGHTREQSTDTAYFGATSFIVPPPYILRGDEKGSFDPAWSFAKVSFRRTVTLRTVLEGSTKKAETLESPPTEAIWVQFLPEFSVLSDNGVVPSNLKVTLATSRSMATITYGDTTEPAALPPKGYDRTDGTFERYLVLTQRVFDVAGKPDQEVYLGVFHSPKPDNSDGVWTTDRPVSTEVDPNRIRARIVDVQRRAATPDAVNGEELWTSVFDDGDDNRRSRIVSISEPIEARGMATGQTGGN